MKELSKNSKNKFCFATFGLYFILSITLFFLGCSEDRDKITPATGDTLPAVKESLKAYHPIEYLTVEVRSAPMLAQKSHPDGWKKSNCIQCHRTPTKIAPEICNNCHGKNGVNDEKDTCSNCHKVKSEFGEPTSGNHLSHVTKGTKDTKCQKCHPGGPEQSKSHANGKVDITINKDGKYASIKGENGIIGSCSSISCHGDERKWGGDCSSCHYDPPDTGYHKQHITQENISCQSCHLGNQHDSDSKSGKIDLGGITYDKTTGSCTSTCHDKPRSWTCTDCHTFPPGTGNHALVNHKVGCKECHSDHTHSYKAATKPLDFSDSKVSFEHEGKYKENNKSCNSISCHESVASERVWGTSCNDCHSSMPSTGEHVLHVQQNKLKCEDCHFGTEHDIYSHSKPVELGGNKVKYDYTTGNCTTTCHKDEKWGCLSCHAYPPNSGSHPAHSGKNCETCHKDHKHSYKSALAPKDFSDTVVNIADGGTFNKSNKLCNGVPCHESRTWGENCTACHASPPKTGSHLLHVRDQNLSCQSCHKGNQHDSNVQSGSIELGGIQYDAITGDCTSNCHGKRSWSCTECHSYPPATGNHSNHKIGCEQCHSDHQHSYKSAMAPKDLSNTQVSFASDIGSFDSKSKDCSNIDCHPDLRTWGENCSACHANPPKTGSHIVHIEQGKLNCQSCHKGNQHDLDVNSGFIDVSDIGYNQNSGSCKNTCHAKPASWGCTSCHAYSPGTGQHAMHTQYACDICHKNHKHTYKAVTSPKDLSNVKVSFAISGSWDKANKACNSIGCHDDEQW